MATIEIRGIEFASASEAIQHVEASGLGKAILVGGTYLVVEKEEAHRLETAGIPFAHIGVVNRPDRPYGVVVHVPIN